MLPAFPNDWPGSSARLARSPHSTIPASRRFTVWKYSKKFAFWCSNWWKARRWPIGSGKALYRGTVWIDRELFVRLKVQAVETHLTGSIVSNDETQMFARTGDVQGRPIWLLDRLVSQQVFLIAGRTVLVEREARMTDVALNAEEFEAGRASARASTCASWVRTGAANRR